MIWYDKNSYQSQNWYSSTFLVHHFKDISRAKKGSKEWNNVEESGCHFTCFSMIMGVNPAQLASKLRSSRKHYFLSDSSIPSIKLNTEQSSHLVWDKNNPSEVGEKVCIDNIFIPSKGCCNVSLELTQVNESPSLIEATSWINQKKREGLHIIAGPESHSFLVAGMNYKKQLLVWDPDTSSKSPEKITSMIEDGISFSDILNEYKIGDENKVQLLAYKLSVINTSITRK